MGLFRLLSLRFVTRFEQHMPRDVASVALKAHMALVLSSNLGLTVGVAGHMPTKKMHCRYQHPDQLKGTFSCCLAHALATESTTSKKIRAPLFCLG